MRGLVVTLSIAIVPILPGCAPTVGGDAKVKPTIVLVHGAFADASSWDGVISELQRDGYQVVAAANPLRSVADDGRAVSAVVRSIPGPVVLVGHSYGGPVITEAAIGNPNVTALVYVAGFIPDTGESSLSLSSLYPGSTLGDALAPVALPEGGEDLYIDRKKFHAQFAADVPAAQTAIMAATQRPVTLAALQEPTGVASWKEVPSYIIYGSADRNIPPAAMKFMAERAAARRTSVLEGASHALMVSHPTKVAEFIEAAAVASPSARDAGPTDAQIATPSDAQIAHIAYTAGELDIAAGKQALVKTQNKEVLAFAEEMVRDHIAVNGKALTLVKKLGVTPEDNLTSQALSKDAEAKLAAYGKLEGAAFDRAYLSNEVAYHKTVNAELSTTLIPGAKNAELRALLLTGLTLFTEHQLHAEHLASDLE